jgi:hypothetical protein
MNLTSDGLRKRVETWATKTPADYTPQPSTSHERQSFNPVNDIDHVEWGAELGRRVDGGHLIAGVYDDLKPLVIQLYFKGNTPAMRHLNVFADEAVAEVIIGVLKKRYPPGGYKVEYYGQKEYQKTDNPIEIDLVDPQLKKMVSRFCMCCVLQESHFASGPEHRDETVRLIDEAIQQM